MSSHYRNYGAGIRSLLFVWLLFSSSSLKADLEEPRPASPTTEAPSQSKDSSDDSEIKIHNYQLKRAKAAEVLKLWKQLHGIKNGATIDERTNSIVFSANDEAAREVGESLALLDSETQSPNIPPTPVAQGSLQEARVPAKSKPASQFRKYTFKHAKAADVLKILREVAGADFDSDDMEGFVVDERTNSFIWKISDVSGNFEEECMKLDTKSPEEDDRSDNNERYERVPVIGPLTEGGVPSALDPPSDDEVIQALKKSRPTRSDIPLLYEKHRNNLKIVKEKIADYVDPPSDVPTIGMAQLHHAHYKCTIYISERTINGWPVPPTLEEKGASEVIYIDHNHFHKCGDGPTPASEAPHSSHTSNFSPGFGRGESLESLKQRYNELEQQTHQLANKLKQSKSPTETELKELQTAVRKSFEARQALQRAELNSLAQRMKSMQQSIDMRDKLADKVVQRRVEDLLNPNLTWDTAPSLEPKSQVTDEPQKSISTSPSLSSVQAAVDRLLMGRLTTPAIPPGDTLPIAFLGIDYQGPWNLGDFKDELQKEIEAQISQLSKWSLVSRRMTERAMAETRVKPTDMLSWLVWEKFQQSLRSMDIELHGLMIARLKHLGDTDSTRNGEYEVSLELQVGHENVFEHFTLKGKANGPSKEPESNSIRQFASPQELLAAVDQYGKSGSYEEFVKLFNDEGVRDLAGNLLMQAVVQTSIAQQLTLGVAEVDPDLVAFRKVLQRWLPQGVTTAQQEAMGKGLSTMMSSIGGATPDQAAMKEFVISMRESVEGIYDHRKFCVEIMQAFEKLTTKRFVYFGTADQENEWQVSHYNDRAIATLIDGSPGMATTITMQQASGDWRISSLFNESVTEAQPITASPTSIESIPSTAKTVTRQYSVGSFVTESFFTGKGNYDTKEVYEKYETDIEQSLHDLAKTVTATCTQPPKFVQVLSSSRCLLIGHTEAGHQEIANFMSDIGISNDRIRLRGVAIEMTRDEAKTLGIELTQRVLSPEEVEKLRAFQKEKKPESEGGSDEFNFVVMDETIQSGTRTHVKTSEVGMQLPFAARIVPGTMKVQIRMDFHKASGGVEFFTPRIQSLSDAQSVLFVLGDDLYWLASADIVQDAIVGAENNDKAASNPLLPDTPAMVMQQLLQGEWDVKVMGISADVSDKRAYQAVVRGQLFLLQCMEDGKVIGTSTWKMIWPEADHPDVVDIVWDPNNNSDEYCAPGRITCDGKSFQFAWRSDDSISGPAIRPTEICSGDGISYFDCVRK